jgi:hypothetical protein
LLYDQKDAQQQLLRFRDAAGVAAKRERLAARGPLRGFVGTISQAIDLIGQYQDAGVQLLIHSDNRNDIETIELLSSEVIPHFGSG